MAYIFVIFYGLAQIMLEPGVLMIEFHSIFFLLDLTSNLIVVFFSRLVLVFVL